MAVEDMPVHEPPAGERSVPEAPPRAERRPESYDEAAQLVVDELGRARCFQGWDPAELVWTATGPGAGAIEGLERRLELVAAVQRGMPALRDRRLKEAYGRFQQVEAAYHEGARIYLRLKRLFSEHGLGTDAEFLALYQALLVDTLAKVELSGRAPGEGVIHDLGLARVPLEHAQQAARALPAANLDDPRWAEYVAIVVDGVEVELSLRDGLFEVVRRTLDRLAAGDLLATRYNVYSNFAWFGSSVWRVVVEADLLCERLKDIDGVDADGVAALGADVRRGEEMLFDFFKAHREEPARIKPDEYWYGQPYSYLTRDMIDVAVRIVGRCEKLVAKAPGADLQSPKLPDLLAGQPDGGSFLEYPTSGRRETLGRWQRRAKLARWLLSSWRVGGQKKRLARADVGRRTRLELGWRQWLDWADATLRHLGIDVKVRIDPAFFEIARDLDLASGKRKVLFLPTHQSLLDHPVMYRVLSSKELGEAMGWSGAQPCVMLARTNLAAAGLKFGPWSMTMFGVPADDFDELLEEVDGYVTRDLASEAGSPLKRVVAALDERPAVIYPMATTAAYGTQLFPLQHPLFRRPAAGRGDRPDRPARHPLAVAEGAEGQHEPEPRHRGGGRVAAAAGRDHPDAEAALAAVPARDGLAGAGRPHHQPAESGARRVTRPPQGPPMDANYDPSEGERNPHKWGYTDTHFEFDGETTVRLTGERYPLAGYTLPSFIPFVEEMLGIPLRREDLQEENPAPEIPEANISEAFLAALSEALDADQISRDDRERLIHSHGQLSIDEVYRILYRDSLERVVDLIVYPHSDEDVQALVELAGRFDAVLIPYGGGTNVSGALAVPPQERRTVVSVDMRRMNRILWIDEENSQACVQAGISGKALEAALGAQGFTSGHDPDSVELSTLGGWIATNASGMKKNRYGNIEDIVLEATLVTPTGVVETHHVTPRNATGVQPRALLFGAEGNFGIVTRAVIKIHPRPEVQAYGSLVFPTFERGVEFLHALRKTGVLPASIRLVNNNEFRFGRALRGEESFWGRLQGRLQRFVLFRINNFDPETMVACTIVMEGTAAEVAQQRRTIFPLARRFGGLSGGSSGGKSGYMLTFGIAYIRDFFSQFRILGETFETSVPWNRIHDVTGSVRKELVEQAKAHGVAGRPYLSYRVTQTYHTGVCIYFTMGFSGVGLEHPDEVYHQIEQRLRQVILDNGGSLSHHHGVGKIRQKFLPQIQTEGSIELLRQVKKAVDPKNTFAVRNGVFD